MAPRNPLLLTPNQALLLEAIAKFQSRCGACPTLRELADICGTSHQAVHETVQALRKKGALVHAPGTAGTIAATPIIGTCK